MADTPRCASSPTVRQLYGDLDAATRERELAWLDAGDGGSTYESGAEREFAAATREVDDLGEQFLGGYVDYEDRTYVYVTDPAIQVDRDAIAERLREATSSISFRVEPGCNSREQLENVHDAIVSPGLLGRWDYGGIWLGVDPASGTVHISIGGADPDGLTDHLQERYGDLVTLSVEEGTIEQTAGSRWNDTEPHYGGARIRAVGHNNCTSGFAVDLSGGPRIMTTAAHCSTSTGTTVNNGQGNRYGRVRHRSYPHGDVASIDDFSAMDRSYHRHVWTSQEGHRLVTSKQLNPWASMSVCLSGANSVSLNCGRTVARNQTACRPNGDCTPGLYRVERDDGQIVVRGGDSGGPAIGRTAPGEANARGQIVVGGDCLSNPRRCPIAFLAPIQLLETQLQVRVATQANLEW